MGRRPKKGLHYFSKDVDYYDDFKIMDLMNEYGPVGQTIYDVILCIVYREGYYIEIPPDKLAMMVVRIIGNRWIKNKDFVLQVIYYCADIDLFSKSLLLRNIITSAGIQRRYADVTVRNKVNKEEYWLLENDQASFSASKNKIKSSESAVSATEMQINDTDIPQKKSKVNKTKEKKSKGEESKEETGGGALFRLFEDCGFQITSHAAEELIILSEEYTEAWVMEAIKRSADRGKKSLAYIRGILNNWQIAGAIDDPQKAHPEESRSYDCEEGESL